MLWPVCLLLLAIMVASRRLKGPLWTLCLTWLFCITPIVTGAVIYRYLVDADYLYSLKLSMFIGAFALGMAGYETVRHIGAGRREPPVPPGPADFARAFRAVTPVAYLCWVIAITATTLNYIDFTLLGGAGLDDLASLRDIYTNKTSASIFAQLASIFTWACLFCFMYAIFFRRELSRGRFIFFLLPIVGYFSLSVFSAGRQAAFQIMLVALLLVLVTRIVRGKSEPRPRRRRVLTGERVGLAVLSTAMIGYMGYVAVARNDGGISDDKSVVLMSVFEFRFAPAVEKITQAMGQNIRGSIVEAVVYFSSSPALFEPFLTITWSRPYFGAMTFPVIFRQIQSLTGLSPTDGLRDKVDAINAIGVIGSGWATAMSSYIIDYGVIGTLVLLFAMGFYSTYAWRKALAFASFYYLVIGVLILLNIVYMPLTPGVTDTNILFLWLFCLAMHHRLYRLLIPVRPWRDPPALDGSR